MVEYCLPPLNWCVKKSAISAIEAEKESVPCSSHQRLHLFHEEEYDSSVLFLHDEQMMFAASSEIPCFCKEFRTLATRLSAVDSPPVVDEFCSTDFAADSWTVEDKLADLIATETTAVSAMLVLSLLLSLLAHVGSSAGFFPQAEVVGMHMDGDNSNPVRKRPLLLLLDRDDNCNTS